MNKIFKYGIVFPCCCLLLSGCDDGKIYPDDSIDAGRTVTIQVSFTGVRAYPDYNMLTFAAFGEDAHEPLLTQRLSRPTEGRVEEYTLMGLPEETKAVGIALVSRGQTLIYKYCSVDIDTSVKETILPKTTVNLATYDRIQEQVFDAHCIACHGKSSGQPAGNLFLTEGKSYSALVNVKAGAPVANEKPYVTPGEPDNSFLIDILSENILGHNHTDIFNGSETTEVNNLLNAWINNGAKEE